MDDLLRKELAKFGEILAMVQAQATDFLSDVASRPVAPLQTELSGIRPMADAGIGTEGTLKLFRERYLAQMSGSAGPRYWGFVTGGATPAAVAGDWLTAAMDQNPASRIDSIAAALEDETVGMLRQLFELSDAFSGAFVTGATMSNFVGLAIAREWVGRQRGVKINETGLAALGEVAVFSGTPHASTVKALSMLGIGRNSMRLIPCLPDREAVDTGKLKDALQQHRQPCIVVASAGTVNTVDFDDFEKLADLKQQFPFWLHVDGAFGLFAAASPKYRRLVDGMADIADSITVDLHKWLNVPYDSAVSFNRYPNLQLDVFRSMAAYLGEIGDRPDPMHLAPESSRRFRALPAWFALTAYGKQGCRAIVEGNCAMAARLSEKIAASERFELLAPTRMNVVSFTIKGPPPASLTQIHDFLTRLQEAGKVFLTQTLYRGRPGMRAAFSNWRTTGADVDTAWKSMLEVISRL